MLDVSEVARFTLDAMPGKQMAIDADLNAGLINEDEAKMRRKSIAKESTFMEQWMVPQSYSWGCIGGILITIVNIIGGILIGVVQQNMEFGTALQNYTVLTIGDGLVGQIPALVISGAAGLTTEGPVMMMKTAGADFSAAFGKSRPLQFLSGALLVFALIPGLRVPFITLAGQLD